MNVTAPSTSTASAAAKTNRARSRQDPVDLAYFVAQLDGDPQAVRDIALAIREDFARRVKEMKAAGKSRDAAKVHHHTHALKSALSILAANRVAQLAASLEDASRLGDWGDYDSTFADFADASDEVDQAIAGLLGQ